VPTGRFSLLPKPLPKGMVQMGFVEIGRTDIVRDSLIGAAPLFTGSLFLYIAGIDRLRLDVLLNLFAAGQFGLFWRGLVLLPQTENFLLWFYLAFAVSSAMLPSEPDRHSWLPLGLWAAVLLALAIFGGAGGWLLENIAPVLNVLFGSMALLFGLSVALHVALLLPFLLFHRLAAKITGIDVR